MSDTPQGHAGNLPAARPQGHRDTTARSGAVVRELLRVVVPVVLIVQLLLLLVLEFRAAAAEHAGAIERINGLTIARSHLLGEQLWRLQYDKVSASLDELALDPFVADAFVEDDTAAVVARAQAGSRVPSGEIVRDLFYADGNIQEKAGRLVIHFTAVPIAERLTTHYLPDLLVAVLAALLLKFMTQVSAEVLIGRPLAQIMSAVQSARSGAPRRIELADANNEIGALAVAFNDLQEAQAHAQSRLEHHALYDDLTGLPNRRFLHQRLATLMQGEPRQIALHFVDLDDFKGINDTFGHLAGDRYLAHVAECLQAAVGRADLVARLGGDEFVVLQDPAVDEAAGRSLAAHLLQAIAQPVDINGKQIVPRGSIGVALRRTDDADFGSLLVLADIALYDVKENRPGCFQLLTPQLLAVHRRRKELAQALPAAFRQGQFEAWFQGQFDLCTGDLVGLEALIRWRHPQHGLIPPVEFVPIIEQSGASTMLARLVFERVCEARLVLSREGLPDLPIAMNISAHELTDFSFGDEMVEIAARYGVPLSGFEIEITEGLLINNVAHTHEALARIRARGTRVALDDFGQGYSSLAYLRRFPLDRLKIDKAFTRELSEGVAGAAVLEVIVGLARKLDLDVVVEGVEDETQADVLRQFGVRVGQGFHYHRPQPLDDVVAFIRRKGFGSAPLRAAS